MIYNRQDRSYLITTVLKLVKPSDEFYIKFPLFQSKYCHDLTEQGLVCPTKDDFAYFDQDKNGILTWTEWMFLHE